MIALRDAAFRLIGAFGLERSRLANRLRASGNRLVLVLHRVLPREAGADLSPAGMVLAEERFARLLDRLAGDFDILGPDAFLAGYPASLGRPSVLLTFDDGWLDVFRHAFPAMRERCLGGVLFASVRHVEEGSLFWPERLRLSAERLGASRFRDLTGEGLPGREDAEGWEALLSRWKEAAEKERVEKLDRIEEAAGRPETDRRVLSWRELGELAAGGIEIGSHGLTHRILTKIPEEEARREAAESRRTIGERTGRLPRLFAYPNGDRSARLVEIVREEGYAYAFSLRGRAGDPFDIPRINVHDGKMTDRRGRWCDTRLLWSLGA
ncbi:MAG: polysaccharide deacetylase family protein [Candidatus Eisenbacteria bacterium]